MLILNWAFFAFIAFTEYFFRKHPRHKFKKPNKRLNRDSKLPFFNTNSPIELCKIRRKPSYSRSSPTKPEKDVPSHTLFYLCLVANIAVVKPDKAEKLEMILIQVSLV